MQLQTAEVLPWTPGPAVLADGKYVIHRAEDSPTGQFQGFHFSAVEMSNGEVALNDRDEWAVLNADTCNELLEGATVFKIVKVSTGRAQGRALQNSNAALVAYVEGLRQEGVLAEIDPVRGLCFDESFPARHRDFGGTRPLPANTVALPFPVEQEAAYPPLLYPLPVHTVPLPFPPEEAEDPPAVVRPLPVNTVQLPFPIEEEEEDLPAPLGPPQVAAMQSEANSGCDAAQNWVHRTSGLLSVPHEMRVKAMRSD